MRVGRWVLLVLYIGLIIGLGGVGLSTNDVGVAIVPLVTIISLALFIFGTGSKDLCRPIRRPRLILPLAVAAFMLCVLTCGLTAALGELFYGYKEESWETTEEWMFWGFAALNWLLWGVLLYVYTRNLQRYHVVFRLARFVFAGSLAETLAVVPSHIFVTRRGGCFAGIGTGFGVAAGLCVMIWSFGPGILLLFYEQAYREQKTARAPRRRNALPTRVYQFRLRTMLCITLAAGVIFGLLRILWDQWTLVGMLASLVILLLVHLLLWRSLILILVALADIGGILYTFWGEWPGYWSAVWLLAGAAMLLLTPAVWPLRHPLPSEGNGDDGNRDNDSGEMREKEL